MDIIMKEMGAWIVRAQPGDYVPKEGRAAWLIQHGPPPPTTEVRCEAPLDAWERAGVSLDATGRPDRNNWPPPPPRESIFDAIAAMLAVEPHPAQRTLDVSSVLADVAVKLAKAKAEAEKKAKAEAEKKAETDWRVDVLLAQASYCASRDPESASADEILAANQAREVWRWCAGGLRYEGHAKERSAVQTWIFAAEAAANRRDEAAKAAAALAERTAAAVFIPAEHHARFMAGRMRSDECDGYVRAAQLPDVDGCCAYVKIEPDEVCDCDDGDGHAPVKFRAVVDKDGGPETEPLTAEQWSTVERVRAAYAPDVRAAAGLLPAEVDIIWHHAKCASDISDCHAELTRLGVRVRIAWFGRHITREFGL